MSSSTWHRTSGLDDGVLPESMRDMSISGLHLSARAYKALLRAGITTAGKVFDAHGSRSGGDVPTAAVIAAKGHLDFLLDTLTSSHEIDWTGYWKQHEIKMLSAEEWSNVTPGEVLRRLPALIREVLREEYKQPETSNRAWTVIQRRFGLEATKQLRLEELGNAFGVTRERVRQIETEALQKLRAALIEEAYAGKQYHVDPAVIKALQAVLDLIASEAAPNSFRAVLEDQLLERMQKTLAVELHQIRPSLTLVLAMAGFERREFDHPDLAPIWSQLPKEEWRAIDPSIKSSVRRIDHLLTNLTGLPMTELDVLVDVNRERRTRDKLTLAQFQGLIDVCSTVERRADGLVWGRFLELRRVNQVERVLFEAAHPLDLPTIVRRINHRLAQHGQQVELRTLQNQIGDDDRFDHIGRSGQWVLKTWEHVHTGTISELMKQCLASMNRSATIEEICAYVHERRVDASEKSIRVYLESDPAFRREERTKWGLAIWPETKGVQVWNPEQVGEFLAQVFQKHKAKELPYQTVRQALMAAADVTAREAQGLLNQNPVIKTRRGTKSDERFAIFQPDWKSYLAGARAARRKSATLRQRVSDTTYRFLEAEPAKELPYAQLIKQLQQELQCPKHTLYRYVTDLDFVDLLDVPGSRGKICRLSGSLAQELLPGVGEIGDAHLRSNIERAVRLLTVDTVDVGLFQLGKEFEGVLKKYLSAAAAKGKVTVQKDPKKMKLVEMVTCAKQNGVIENAGDLQYLREHRNDRAHGPTPSLAEREIMLKTAPHFAGMYIDYIKLIDDLHTSLG